MKNKNGIFSFEAIVFLSFIALLTVSSLAFFKLSLRDSPLERSIKTPIEAYGKILTSLRNDAMFSSEIEVNNSELIFLDTVNNKILYKLINNSLCRISSNNKKTVLMNEIERVKFKKDSKVPLLFSVYIYPKNKMFIPFFTSFALRSGKIEGENL